MDAETVRACLQAVKDERARMESDNQYVLAHVYGINNAVDVLEEMLEEAT